MSCSRLAPPYAVVVGAAVFGVLAAAMASQALVVRVALPLANRAPHSRAMGSAVPGSLVAFEQTGLT